MFILKILKTVAKKSLVARQNKRLKLVRRFAAKRAQLKLDFKASLSKPLQSRFPVFVSLQKLPRNSSRVRLKNRCFITGRAKAYHRDFGLCRHQVRQFAHRGFLPGVTKSSW